MDPSILQGKLSGVEGEIQVWKPVTLSWLFLFIVFLCGGLKHFVFEPPYPKNMIQFDKYDWNGLRTSTSLFFKDNTMW